MARFMLSAAPFSGHVAPLASVAEALVSRGHSVRFYTGSAFRDQVERAGATLIPWTHAPDFDEQNLEATFPRLVGKKGVRQLIINVVDCFINTAPAQVEDLQAAWDREPWDACAADEVSLGAVFLAKRMGKPWSTIAVLPLQLPGPAGPPSGLGIAPGTGPIGRARDAALRILVPAMSGPLRRPLARAQADVGIVDSHLTPDRLGFSDTLIVASGAPLLDYGRTDRPDWLHFVGEIRKPASAGTSLPPWWPELAGRTVIHVTQGTLNIDSNDLIRPALDALADRDALVVVSTGTPGRDTLPFAAPANARVGGILPYAELLPQADLVVTNGGWGGVLASLACGVPLVVAGGDLDKPEVAGRVAWAGAGVNLRTGRPTAEKVAAGIDRVLTEPSFRAAAKRVGAQLTALGGAARAAELLEHEVS